MTTMIEDKELTAELKELYLIGKHWVSDLEIFERDIRAVKKQIQNSGEGKEELLENLGGITENLVKIKDRVFSYLQLIEPLTQHSEYTFPLNLIETHAGLEREISGLLKTFSSLKQRLAYQVEVA